MNTSGSTSFENYLLSRYRENLSAAVNLNVQYLAQIDALTARLNEVNNNYKELEKELEDSYAGVKEQTNGRETDKD